MKSFPIGSVPSEFEPGILSSTERSDASVMLLFGRLQRCDRRQVNSSDGPSRSLGKYPLGDAFAKERGALTHLGKKAVKRHCDKGRKAISDCIGQHDSAVMDHCAATVDDIGDIAGAFVRRRP